MSDNNSTAPVPSGKPAKPSRPSTDSAFDSLSLGIVNDHPVALAEAVDSAANR